MIKGAIGIVGLATVVWAVGCGTHSGIGNLGMGGNGGEGVGTGGQGVIGTGGDGVGIGGQGVIGTGGDLGIGGQGVLGTGGDLGIGGQGITAIGGAPGTGGGRAFCPGATPPIGTAKTLAFAAPVDYSIGNGVLAVATGDLNGDGKLDLVLLDRTLGVRLMLNNGNGTFAATVNLGLAGPTALAVGDLDGDGKADIVDVSASAVSVFLNRGNATFGPPVNYVVGNGSEGLALGDLNGDGKLDIAVVDGGDGSTTSLPDVGVLVNTGNGTFMPANYPAGRQPFAIAIGDLDNDCQPDLVLTQPTGVTALLNSFGEFPSSTTFANGTAGQSVAVADLNGDGKLDLVEGPGASSDDGRTYVLLNRGNASFNAPIVYSVSATITSVGPSFGGGNLVAVADMNGDGRPDLLTLASCCGLGVFLNRGDGTFPAPVTFPTPASPFWLTAGDLNGDGQPDVAVVSGSGLRVLINTSH